MIIHCCLSVRGALRWDKRKLRQMTSVIVPKDSPKFTPDGLRDWLMDQLSQGREVIPIGALCDGFDYKTGCPGHESEPAA